MIEIRADPNRIALYGHANYAEPGKDIVCAAVSALVYTLQESIEKLTDDIVGFSFFNYATVIEFGELTPTAKALIESFIVGCSLIAGSYPDNVVLYYNNSFYF